MVCERGFIGLHVYCFASQQRMSYNSATALPTVQSPSYRVRLKT